MDIQRRYRPLLRVGFIVAFVVAAKIGVYAVGWEFISINPLFSGVVAANVFLMGDMPLDFRSGPRVGFPAH